MLVSTTVCDDGSLLSFVVGSRSALSTVVPTSLRAMAAVSVARRSVWSHIEKGPEDPILGLTLAFNNDTDPNKINLGVGAYRDNEGKPFVLECVREAERRIAGTMNHEYAPIQGVPEYIKVSQDLLFGADSEVLKNHRVATVQSLSGTGSLRLGFEFIKRFFGDKIQILVSDPTWGNHFNIIRDTGLTATKLAYWDPVNRKLDLPRLLDGINTAPDGSVLMLHTCAHNPTGMDPTKEQWGEIMQVTKAKRHLCFFDTAYQGFASGDPELDAWSVREFVANNVPVMYAQSFAKNIGLYGQRTGSFGVVCDDRLQMEAVLSQLKILARPMYSNPPVHGARIVSTILADPALNADWRKEVKQMADRIIAMRSMLVGALHDAGSLHDWSHITKQIGMFSFTGLTPKQVERLREEYHVYMTGDGRISMAGITSKNVKYLAESIHAVSA